MRDLPGDVCLIAQIPVNRLPEHVGNLRSILQARLGFSRSEEVAMVADIKKTISHRLPAVFDACLHANAPPSPLPINPSWAVKAEIGQWLRCGVAAHLRSATS